MEPGAFHDAVRYLIVPKDKQDHPGFADLKVGEPSALIDPIRLQIVEAMQAQSEGVSFDSLDDTI